MRTVATIKHNDERIAKRVRLGVVRESSDDGWRYTVRTGTGEETCVGTFKTRADALAAIDHAWGADVWDLQYA